MTRSMKIGIWVVGLIVILSIIFSIVASFNDHQYTITVTDKDRVTTQHDDKVESKYLVFGEDKSGNSLVFENTDNLFRGKFNSSNLQGQLKQGETYIITVVGFRIPFISMYENIIKIEEVN